MNLTNKYHELKSSKVPLKEVSLTPSLDCRVPKHISVIIFDEYNIHKFFEYINHKLITCKKGKCPNGDPSYRVLLMITIFQRHTYIITYTYICDLKVNAVR